MLSPQQFPAEVIEIIETLQKGNFQAFVVGGCVRDLLLKKKPSEWDITTDATPTQVTKLFKKVIPTGLKFGTVTVLLENGQYEVTTFRADEKYTDGRRPESVLFTEDINIDLSRRDFTINALAYDPISKKLLDNHHGQKDLTHKIIRTVGNPQERFSEDGLRPFRACRFAAQLEFEIESQTFQAISISLETSKKVAPERIRDEIIKMLKAPKPSIGIEYLRKSGLLGLIMPELERGCGISQPEPYHKYDVYWHALKSCDAAPADNYIVRLAALLHDISKPECKVDNTFYGHDQKGAAIAQEILKRLRFSNEEIDQINNLVKNHMFNYTREWTDAAVRRFIKRVGLSNLENLFSLRASDVAGMEREIDNTYIKELSFRIKKILEEQNALEIKDLAVNGHEIMRILELPPSPKIGEILNQLLEKVLDDPKLNQKDILIEMAKNF